MKILVAAIFSIDSYSRGIMPDVLQTTLEQYPDASVFYLSNSNSFDICYFNMEKRPEVCFRCKAGVKNTLSMVDGRFTHLRIKDMATKEDIKRARAFLQGREISFDLYYEDFEIGAATLSTYISRTRDRDLHYLNQSLVRELAENALVLYLALKRFIQEEQIEKVFNFNGRQEYVRAVMRAALAVDVDCWNVERTRLEGHVDYYRNILPHDPANKWRLAEYYWKESDLPEEEKRKVGASFFERQKAGESIAFQSYTRKMKKGEVPKNFKNGRNLVLFNSSDDEVAAFGETFKNPFFTDQNEGLEYLVELVGKNFPFYNLIIRMHPNLEGVQQEYVQRIKNLHQKFPNIYVIEPQSPVDTYALMEIAEKVITFGSTTGIEANFLRKPVILLGIGFYNDANYGYQPSSKEDIEPLLQADLPPKPVLDSLKVGFNFLKGGQKARYYYESEIGRGIFFKGKRVHFYTVSQRLKAKIIEKAFRFFRIRLQLKA